jgi:hypothetical protein
LQVEPVAAMDYLELGPWIVISLYLAAAGSAEHLIVMEQEGTVVLREKAGEGLKGIGMDTFFILEGSLFFVKNKKELVCYKLL